MAEFHFDANQHEPENPFDPLPAGDYIAQVVDSDVKPNKNGTGSYMALQFEVLDGEFKGRRVFTNITVRHQNQQAERIGQGKISALCRAVNVMQLTNTSQLHGRPLRIRVTIVEKNRGPDNEVKGFAPANAARGARGAQRGAQGQQPWQGGQGQQQAPQGQQAPPWGQGGGQAQQQQAPQGQQAPPWGQGGGQAQQQQAPQGQQAPWGQGGQGQAQQQQARPAPWQR